MCVYLSLDCFALGYSVFFPLIGGSLILAREESMVSIRFGFSNATGRTPVRLMIPVVILMTSLSVFFSEFIPSSSQFYHVCEAMSTL